jgi:hypothetical protein
LGSVVTCASGVTDVSGASLNCCADNNGSAMLATARRCTANIDERIIL